MYGPQETKIKIKEIVCKIALNLQALLLGICLWITKSMVISNNNVKINITPMLEPIIFNRRISCKVSKENSA